MGLRQIESLGAAPGYVPVMIGNSLGQTQTITNQEIATELTARNYRPPMSPAISPPVSPVVRTTLPTITRPQAIKYGVDAALKLYRLPLKCTTFGGCRLSEYRWNDIIRRAAASATNMLRTAGVRTSTVSISPITTYTRLRGANVSPRARGIGGTLYGLGQGPGVLQPVITQPPTQQPVTVEEPGMTTWEKILMIAGMVKGGITALEAYSTARVQRERAGVTATLTAEQVKAVVNQTMAQNPTLDRSLLEAAAAGAGGRDEPKGMPSWIVPAVVGIGVVAFMSSGMFRGRRR